MADPRAVLEQQLAMNRQSWQALRDAGVDESSQLRLDFFYAAPDEESAEGLAELIREHTDYDVGARSLGGGFLKKKDWVVTGSTQPTAVSLSILDQWVEWMVSAGFERGCVFDGWGAQA
jgi:hypothetical protein